MSFTDTDRRAARQKLDLERLLGSKAILLQLEGGQVKKYANGKLELSNMAYFCIYIFERT